MSRRHRPSARSLRFEGLESRLALATFHVSLAGQDTNLGTAAAPWRTLQKAANTVRAGDTVEVSAGNYVGFDLRTDGTAAQPIVFRAQPGTAIDARNVRTPDGINLEGADYVTIEGFTVNNMPRAGIRSVLNHHVVIRNNSADNNAKWGIFTGFSDDILIEGNTTSRSQIEHGIYFSNSADRPIIRNNISWGNRANGIHMNGDIHAGGDGIISGALVEGNVIYGNGLGGGSSINADGVQNSTFRNNVIYDARASGISLYRTDGAAGSSGNLVVNNTVIVSSTGRWALNIQSGSTGNTVRNNILYNNHSFRGAIDISADSLPGFTSDYNVMLGKFTTNGGNSVQTLPQWQTATGQDLHSKVATPSQLFVNPTGNDYHLSATSPALDAGTAQFAPPRDRDGNPRPSGAGFDVGAYERLAAPVNRAPLAANDVQTVLAGAAIDVNVLANDSDPDGNPLTVGTFSQGSSGSVVKLASGQLRYTPTAGFSGTDTFTYRASDGSAQSNLATVTVTVTAPPPTSTVQVLDNADAAFSTSGTWISYPGQGLRGTVHYTAAGTGAAARWTANVTPGQYRVSTTWSHQSNRATDAPYTVLDGATRLGTVDINQELPPVGVADQGVHWQTLGTFVITGNRLVVELGNEANEYVIADGIRLERIPDAPPPPATSVQTIDNRDLRFTTAGPWIQYPGQGFGGDVHYTSAGSGGVSRWTAAVAPGTYRVAATWSQQSNRATNAPFTVRDGAASLGTVRVNQELAPAGLSDQGVSWQSLGTFTVTGDKLVVELGSDANEYVIADAIRLERVDEALAQLLAGP